MSFSSFSSGKSTADPIHYLEIIMVAYIMIILSSSDNLPTFRLPGSVSYHLQPQDFLLRSFVFLEYFVHIDSYQEDNWMVLDCFF